MIIPGVQTEIKVISESMQYQNTEILTYRIEYPQFRSERFRGAAARMSSYYEEKARQLERYCRKRLFPQAVEQYHYSLDHSYPLMVFEAVQKSKVTYNRSCAVSLYTDQYLYTGGANGTTTRTSETWDLRRGRQMALSRFFSRKMDYKAYILENINMQIGEQIENGDGNYFEPYQENVREEFDVNQFYLTNEGIVIYYQVYAIAPHSSGIPTFLLPYSDGVVLRPHC